MHILLKSAQKYSYYVASLIPLLVSSCVCLFLYTDTGHYTFALYYLASGVVISIMLLAVGCVKHLLLNLPER